MSQVSHSAALANTDEAINAEVTKDAEVTNLRSCLSGVG